MRQKIKHIFYIGLIIAGILITWQLRGCIDRPSSDPNNPIFITDTLDYEIPGYVDRPSLIFKIGHVHSEPRTTQPVKFQPWMDSVYRAHTVIDDGKKITVIGNRGESAHKQTFTHSVRYELYGTPTGFVKIDKRFSMPVRWSGFWLYNELSIVPNITNSFGAEMGFQFWRIKLDAYGEYRQMKQDGESISDNVIGIKTRLRIW